MSVHWTSNIVISGMKSIWTHRGLTKPHQWDLFVFYPTAAWLCKLNEKLKCIIMNIIYFCVIIKPIKSKNYKNNFYLIF